MKIQEFLDKQNTPYHSTKSDGLWAKKFSDVHLPTEDRFSGTTLCGTPMLGNNYATVAIAEDRDVCSNCLSHFKFGEPLTARGDNKLEVKENPFTQLCVWPGTLVGKEKIEEFTQFMSDNFYGTRIKYVEEVKTLPDVVNGKVVPDTGGRNDVFFYVHTDDLSKFSITRLAYGIRWWEDVLGNGGGNIYPDSILEKYQSKLGGGQGA